MTLFNKKVKGNWIFTISDLSQLVPQVLQTVSYETITQKLGFKTFCARWVPKVLTDEHKTKRMESALDFLTQYEEEGDKFKFLDQIMTGDKTWLLYVKVEQKDNQWSGVTTRRR